MKNLLILISLFLFIACEQQLSKEEIVKSNIEAYFKEKAHDPSSFEFVEMSEIEGVTNQDLYNYKMELKEKVRAAKRKADLEKIKVNQLLGNDDSLGVKNEAEEKERLVNANQVQYYEVNCKFRAKNKLGALSLHEYKVQLDTLFNVMSANK